MKALELGSAGLTVSALAVLGLLLPVAPAWADASDALAPAATAGEGRL